MKNRSALFAVLTPLVTLLLRPALGQEAEAPRDKPPAKPKPGEIEIPEPGTAIEDSAVARRQVARFQTAWKAAQSSEDKLKALADLGRWNHAEVLKAAGKAIRDRDYKVAVAAVVVCARQAAAKDKAGKLLFGCLKREKRKDVVCALLVGLGKLGYDKKAAIKEACKYIRRDTTETHKAAIRYLGYVKWKPGFRMLAEYLDEPRPKNPDDPNNPPASWWKERWYEWNSNVKYTRWALTQLVPGETFETTREAKSWAETEGRAHGIRW